MAHPITRYREEHGLTKAELARRARIPWRRLHRVETGEQPITAATARAIHNATAGALSAATLLGLETDDTKAA